MKSSMIKYGLIAAVIGGVYLYSNTDNSGGTSVSDIDLNAVLDVTVNTIYSYEEGLSAQAEDERDPEQAFLGFSKELAENYNGAQPVLHHTPIGTVPRDDASILGFEDVNNNKAMDEGENALFLVEIDGENSRIVATSGSGAVNEHRFSGSGLLAGYLIGSMLSRQSLSGGAAKVAAKKPVTAGQAARSRAGSGSHSKGK